MTYSRDAFETVLDEVGSLLGDLWAVDQVLARTRDGDHRVCVKVMVGRAHPFDASVFVAAPRDADPTAPVLVDRDAVQREVHEVARLGAAWGSAVVDALRAVLADVVRPVAGEFEAAVEVLRSDLVGPLATGVADDFAHLSSRSDWEGGAAADFADYYDRIEVCVRNQTYAAEGICFGLAGAKAVVDLGQQSLMELVRAARDGLDEQLRQRAASHGSTGSSGPAWLLLAATCAALVGAIPTGGLSVAAASVAVADATGILLSYAASGVPGGEEEAFDATTADEAAAALYDAGGEISRRVDDHWNDLGREVEKLRDAVRVARDDDRLTPPRPRAMLDGRVSPSQWHHESEPR